MTLSNSRCHLLQGGSFDTPRALCPERPAPMAPTPPSWAESMTKAGPWLLACTTITRRGLAQSQARNKSSANTE